MIDGILPGAFALGGKVIEGIFGSSQAKRQMDFQERMANTVYQRKVADLQAAGLNPALAYEGGGSPAPAGAMASTPDTSSVVSSAQQGRLINEQVEQIKAQTKQALSQASLNKEMENLNRAKFASELVMPLVNEALAAQYTSSAGVNVERQREIQAQIKVLEETAKLVPEQRAKVIEERLTEPVRRALFGEQAITSISQTQLNRAITELRKLERNEYQASSEFFGGAIGEQSPLLKLLMQLIRTVK